MYRSGISATKCEICVRVCGFGGKKEEVEKAGAANQERTRRPETAAAFPLPFRVRRPSGAQPNARPPQNEVGKVPLTDPTLDEKQSAQALRPAISPIHVSDDT